MLTAHPNCPNYFFTAHPISQLINGFTASRFTPSLFQTSSGDFKSWPHSPLSHERWVRLYCTPGNTVTPGTYGTYCCLWWKRSWIFSMIWAICLWQYESRSLKVSRACSTRFSQLRLVKLWVSRESPTSSVLISAARTSCWNATTRCRVWSWATSWWSAGSMGGGWARAARERKSASHPPHPWAKSQRGCESFSYKQHNHAMRNWMQALIAYTPSKVA